MFATFKYYWNGEKNWEKNRTLLALTLENSVLKSDKKTNIIFWESVKVNVIKLRQIRSH